MAKYSFEELDANAPLKHILKEYTYKGEKKEGTINYDNGSYGINDFRLTFFRKSKKKND